MLNGESIRLTKGNGNGWAAEYGVIKPEEEIELKPGAIIFLEEPFGREREELAELIDLVIYLDIPDGI